MISLSLSLSHTNTNTYEQIQINTIDIAMDIVELCMAPWCPTRTLRRCGQAVHLHLAVGAVYGLCP